MAVLLEDGDAEAVEGVDIAGIVVAGQRVDPLPHLIGRLVGKRDAQNMPRQNAELGDQKGEAVRQGPGLSGTGPGDHPHEALRRGDGGSLRLIQAGKQVFHSAPFRGRHAPAFPAAGIMKYAGASSLRACGKSLINRR